MTRQGALGFVTGLFVGAVAMALATFGAGAPVHTAAEALVSVAAGAGVGLTILAWISWSREGRRWW